MANAGLCVLDLNIQSIYAKFDEFQLFIERVSESHPISVICLNECWINEGSDLTTIQLPNYKMFHERGTRVGHGHCGLVMYVHEQFKCKEIQLNEISTTWDYQCIELSHSKPNSKKYIVCNFYRLPGGTVEELNIFTDEFSTVLNKIKRLKVSSFICGDGNIDLLKISTNRSACNFFESVISNGFFPRITLPTRLSVSGNSNTLIDNIWTNCIEDNVLSESGILINDISDHKIIFTCQDNNAFKDNSEKSIEMEVQNCIDELISLHNQISP